MTSYRLWPSVSGPDSATSYSGSFISGLNFTVTQSNVWLEGYWWWVAGSNQSASPVECALWTVAGSYSGVLVPGSVAVSGTLVTGQWNWIPLAVPVQLAIGYVAGMTGGSSYSSSYCAAVGVNGNFPDTGSYWGSGPGSAGITNGPLFAYSGSSNSFPPPYTRPQGCFVTAGSDPSLLMPSGASGTDNFWVDVQVTASPPSYSGSYRIWPNKADTNSVTGSDSAVAYIVGTEVDLSVPVTLNYVHYFVPSGSPNLGTAADLWLISSGTQAAQITSPAWVTESGGSVGSSTGLWVKAPFPGNTTVPPGKYRVSVYNANGTSGAWGAKDATSDYWYAGAGQNGITWGPVTAPNFTNAQLVNVYDSSGTTGGQPCFAVGPPDQFPDLGTGIAPAQNYWVDLEVTPIASSSGSVTALGIPHPFPDTTEPGVFTGTDPEADVGEPDFLNAPIGIPHPGSDVGIPGGVA
jgi:hypothetical protein